ncbi:hypothetical protein RM52_07495 [Microbacterium hominis]|uniref:Uncharacterized protein n=1 Tax=Microbacterium hominis TaxID=162426 RepID=A0A0B4C9T8_9MICO|nr:hypothetical protein RM52_07495 [Microbacterium hominis]
MRYQGGRGATRGSFYTGNWDVKIPGDFDIAAFIGSLPAAVGEGWTVRKSSIPVSYATVEFVKAAEGVSVTLDDASIPGAAVLDILGMSACAQTPERAE